MIKKTTIVLAIVLLVFSGCAKKKPQPSNSNEIAQDTISLDDGTGSNEFGSGAGFDSGADMSHGVASNPNGYNSSSDGMKSLYFPFDQYSISPAMQETILFNANLLRQKSGGSRVKVEGNCDEFGTDEYNYALGLKRAKAVKDSLVMQGIEASKIVLVSFGESNPKCRDMSDSCYDQNRRVDLHLLR